MTKTTNIVAFFCLLLLGFLSPNLNAQQTKFPIPAFATEQRTIAADRLKASMSAVRAHLCQKPIPVTTQWQQEFDDLLIGMIVDEHNLVWVTGARFSPEENRDERRFYTEKDKLVAVLKRAVNQDASLKPVLEKVKVIPADVTSSSDGRGMMRIFALRNFLVETERASIGKLAAIGEVPAFNRAIQDMLNALGSAQHKIYSRTFVEINQNVPADARFRFSIHSVPDNLRTRVDEAVANEALRSNRVRGLTAADIVRFDTDSAHRWTRLSSFVTLPFDAVHERTFRGDCVKTVTITDQLHHIGDGSYGASTECASEFRLPAAGPIYRADFVIPNDRVLKPFIEIEQLCGHGENLQPVVILINQRRAGEIHRNGRNLIINIPVELLNLQGRKNSIEIVAPKDTNRGVDDLEFRVVRLRYQTRAD